MNYLTGLIGMWIMSDALYSLALYLGKESWRDGKQTWAKDHWVRAVRFVCGVTLMVIGYMGR